MINDENTMNPTDSTEAENPNDASAAARDPDREEANESPEGGPAADALAAELAELTDRHLRLKAEFENYRKRTREEVLTAAARGQATLLGSLMDVFDDFERMHQVVPEQATVTSVLEGVQLVERKLQRVLAEAGLELVEPAGTLFDPAIMEAVVRVPVEDPEEDDQVSQVLQRGAVFKGHLVRPARVAVKKAD